MSDAPRHELEPSPDEMRDLVARAMDRIVAHVASLPEQPAGWADPAASAAAADALRHPLPETGTPFEELLDIIFERAAPYSWTAAGPGYLAYIPGGGLFQTAVADLIAESINRYTGVSAAAPALVQLEANAIRWLCEVVGWDESAYGFFTTGGSLANFSGIVTARSERLGEEFLEGVVYVGEEVHHSIDKAARLAGIRRAHVRRVPSDARRRMRIDRLRAMIAEDRAAGRRPFCVVGSAGTVGTGAVDDLDGLADVAAEEGLAFHVDAAYGGFFLLTERGRAAMRGIARADTVTLDPHKGLFLPLGTGCLLARDGHALVRTHGAWADYLPEPTESLERADACQVSPELSKAFRGIRVWLPLMLHGVGAFRRCLDEKLDLARHASAALAEIDGVRVVAEPELSLVAFRLEPPGVAGEALDRLNREVLRRVCARGRVWLSGTVLGGVGFVLRMCILSFRTHRDRVDAGLEDVRAAVAGALAEG